jgi:hypothetical protein
VADRVYGTLRERSSAIDHSRLMGKPSFVERTSRPTRMYYACRPGGCGRAERWMASEVTTKRQRATPGGPNKSKRRTRDGEPVESVLPLRAPSEATPVATEPDAEPERSGLAAEARRRLCTQLHRLHAEWVSARDLDDPWGADMGELLMALALAAEDDGTVLQGVVHSSPSATATSPGTVDAEPLDLKPWLRSAADEARKLRERPIARSASKGQGRARRPRHRAGIE